MSLDDSAEQNTHAGLATQLTALTLRVAELERRLAEPERRLAEPSRQPASLPQSAAAPGPAPVPQLAEPPPPPAALPPFPAPGKSLEDRLGAQIFNWIGMAALLIGVSWGLKLAFEHGLIGPIGRVVIGFAAGAALILWSERFRRKGLPAFSYSLKAVGSGILYLALWAAFRLYHLMPASVAFAAMALVTGWIAFMAFAQDSELLAAYALAGGLATPLLLSTGGDRQTFLFSYLLVIDLASVLLLRFKPWPRLLPAAFLATVAYFIAWYATWFHRGYINTWNSQSTETSLFVALFFAAFTLPSLRGWSPTPPTPAGSRRATLLPVLLPLANAAFFALALYSVFQDSSLHASLAWLMLALAALSLALARLQATALGSAMQLATAVILLTIAIPLKASGHTLTTAWLVEGLVLAWASTRVEDHTAEPSRRPRLTARAVLRALSAGGYVLGLIALAFDRFWLDSTTAPFFNASLGSALVAIASLAGAAWLAHPPRQKTPSSPAAFLLSLLAIDLVALLLILGELSPTAGEQYHPSFASSAFATALIGLAVLAAVAETARRLADGDAEGTPATLDAAEAPPTYMAGGNLIAFNLFAVLIGVREIRALWQHDLSAATQRSLAVSAFLMAYGALLLAAGFWRRSAFVRWQALALLVFTILKVFLFDVSGLSQGYRVASFLGLGALLMAVSLAYQKDWLGLKAATPKPPSEPPSPAPEARP